jgi:hypothetical protein
MSGIRLSTYHTGTMKDIQDVFALVKMKIVSYPCNLYPKKIPKRAKIFQGKFKMKPFDDRVQNRAIGPCQNDIIKIYK